MPIEAILILFGIFLYVFLFSFYALSKKLQLKPSLLLSLAYATVGTMSLTLNPMPLIEAPIPLLPKVFAIFIILMGWFIVALMFFSGALTMYFKLKALSYKHVHYPSFHSIQHEQTYSIPIKEAITQKNPKPRKTSHPRSSDEIVRKLLGKD
jgi:hypothetical protein